MILLPLIRKLKEAREPSRELDAKIYCATHKYAAGRALRAGKNGYVEVLNDGEWTPDYTVAPHYTASVDAAFLLLRKHYMWQLKRGIECEAIVWWLGKDWDDTGAPTARQLPEYPALALTTAILIARAVEDREIHLGDEI